MSNISKENDDDEKPSVSKIYETLKSKPFLKNLYFDVLSGLKEKPTFKRMRETIKKIVNQKLGVLEAVSRESDNELEKTIVAEICSMAYAVDTVYSKILYIKLEQEFNSQICNIIKDLRNEGEIPDDIWAELQTVKSSDECTKEKNNSSKKTETPVKSTPVSVKEPKEMLCNGDKKLGNRTYSTRNNTENEKKLSPKKMETKSQAVPKKTVSANRLSSIPKKSLVEEIINVSAKGKTQDSDTESEISVGHVSLASVSSVHTSDLSSYDDEISLSSEDEGGSKKKYTLKELISQNSNMSSKLAEKLSGTKLKKTSKSSKASHNNNALVANSKVEEHHSNSILEKSEVKTSLETTDGSLESTANESSLSNTTSKRIRKPNSKYSSDTILCHSVKVKERKKQPIASSSDKKSSSEISSKRKRTLNEMSNTEVEMPHKAQKMDVIKENTSSDNKSPSKQYESPNLHKPHSTVRSLTSRRTAPVTLYSTAP